MTTRTLSIMLLALALPTTPALADDPAITLAALMEAGRRSHPTLAKRPLLAESLAIQDDQIDQIYWPHLSLGAQATWQSDVTSLPISVPGIAITPPAKDQYKVTLELQQTLWDGGVASRQKRVAAHRTQVLAAQTDVEWYQVRDHILQLYFAAVVQQELAHQAEQLDAHLAKIIEQARVGRANGVLIERDVLLLEARQIEARQAANDAEAQLVTARRGLADLTGMALAADRGFAPEAACVSQTDPRTPPDRLHRPELAVLAAQHQLLIAQDDLDTAADRPRVGVFATGGYGRPGLDALSNQFELYLLGGVQLTVPLTYLYAGTHERAHRQLAVQQALLARQRDVVVAQIDVQLDAARAEQARLDAALTLDAQLVDLRERARAFTETQLALGTATATDLVNDLTQEDQARSRRVVHRAQRSLACRQLAFIAGDL
jgi:outer membrane protein TolC